MVSSDSTAMTNTSNAIHCGTGHSPFHLPQSFPPMSYFGSPPNPPSNIGQNLPMSIPLTPLSVFLDDEWQSAARKRGKSISLFPETHFIPHFSCTPFGSPTTTTPSSSIHPDSVNLFFGACSPTSETANENWVKKVGFFPLMQQDEHQEFKNNLSQAGTCHPPLGLKSPPLCDHANEKTKIPKYGSDSCSAGDNQDCGTLHLNQNHQRPKSPFKTFMSCSSHTMF